MPDLPGKYHLPDEPIDFTAPFYPAHLTALYYTSCWKDLTDEQRRRYTQHYALYLNEQTAFFEEQLAETVLPGLYKNPKIIGDKLASHLRQFQEEERMHTQMFRGLSHKVDPKLFSLQSQSYHFIKVSPFTIRLMNQIAGRPWIFPYWIWLVLLQEERSLAISKACINDNTIEPTFRHSHLIHLRDETNHVHWDLQIIEALWKPKTKWMKSFNVKMFRWTMREFFTAPKRAAKAVTQALIDDFPELESQKKRFFSELKQLKDNKDYHRSLYSRPMTPRAFALFDKLPEFNGLEKTLLGYDPS